MKAVMLSIQPKWCELIASGKKTIEVRKTRPAINTPFKCYIYKTKKPVAVMFSGTGKHISEYDKTYCYNSDSGKVIGEFVCNKIEKFVVGSLACDDVEKQACISYKEICDYYYGNNYDNTVRVGFAWHISDLKIYDTPLSLNDFGISNAPQSWRYI